MLPALLLMTGLSSCLKQAFTPNLDPAGGSNNVVEFQNTSIPESYNSIYAVYDNSDLTITNDTTGFNVIIDYAGPELTAPQDITVSLAQDTTVNTTYNAEAVANSSQEFSAPDSSLVSFPRTITIKKGTSQTMFRVTLYPAKSAFSFDSTYALGLTIKSSSYGSISGNYGSALFAFTVMNDWAGSYAMTGRFFHPNGPRALDASVTLSTAGATKLKFPFGDLGDYYWTAAFPPAGGALTDYKPSGSTPALPKSGFMYQDNSGGVAFPGPDDLPGEGEWKSSIYNNSFDASTNTFMTHVGYNANGASSEADYTRQVYMKFVKK